MKLTKEPRDLKNIGNLSVDELEYLQNALTYRAGHLLDLTKELDAARRAALANINTAYAAQDAGMASTAQSAMAADEAQRAALANITANTVYAALDAGMASTAYTAQSAMSADVAQRAALDSIASGIASLTINPNTSLAALLATVDYPASATDALSKDWQNVGNDLWKSYTAIKHEHK